MIRFVHEVVRLAFFHRVHLFSKFINAEKPPMEHVQAPTSPSSDDQPDTALPAAAEIDRRRDILDDIMGIGSLDNPG